MRGPLVLLTVVTLATTLPVAAQTPAAPARFAADQWSALHWRNIGPEGNRFTSAAGVVGDPLTYFVGSASGGVWKTTDGGVNWRPTFDAHPVQSIGALAVARSDRNVVWAGTGEAHIRSHISLGQGIYKSTDGGESWTLMGLEKTARIARIVIHPTNPDVVLVCALGHAYGPQQERGVYRTTDGGANWTRVLFTDENAGCSDLAMDANNPRVLFAGMWQIEIRTWGRTSGGPGSGLFTSRDGGVTWTKLRGNGLPTKPHGKVALGLSPSNSQRVYVMIETGDGVPWNGQETESGQLWRSEDGGQRWALVSRDRNVMGRAHYYSRMVVAPDDEDEAYFLTASFAKSIDGGRTLNVMQRAQAPGGDHHDMWIDPTNPDRQIVAHDQGLSISQNRGQTWFRQRLSNAQIYHVTVDNNIPYNVLGNKQDEPTYRGPSNSRLAGGQILRGMWHAVGGGESGWATPDPVDPNIVWSTASGSGMVGGIVVRYEEDRRMFRTVEVWPDQSRGPASGVKYRFVWDAPLTISPHDHNTVYTGSQHVHRTSNGGQSWEVISPDLTLNDRSRMGSSGGLTGDNIGVEYAGVVYAITESPREKGTIWIGTNDGLVQLTRDDGRTWTNLTKNIPGLPVWGSVRSIVSSKYDAATAYLTVDFHQVNNRDPFVYRTNDYGRTWKAITNGLPRNNLSYAKVIHEDPKRRGLLYLGLENGIYVSFDAGDNWLPLQNDLPAAPVSGIQVQEHFNDLVISTYGRGFYILDDLAPLQQLTPEVSSSATHLFDPRAAYRFRFITAPSQSYDDPTRGEDPRYGAYLNYWLKAPAAQAPQLFIRDAAGKLVRTLTGTNTAGINRVVWDLRDEPSIAVRLRTSPMYAPYIAVSAAGREAPGVTQVSVLMPPGTYKVTLKVGDSEQTRDLVVRKDPNTGGTEGDIAEQTRIANAIREDLNRGAATVHRVEAVRVQLAALRPTVSDAEVLRAIVALEEKLVATEMELVDLRQTGQGQDGVRWEAKLLAKLGYLAGGLTNNDFRATDQQVEVQTLLSAQLRTQLTAIESLLGGDLNALNAMLRQKGIPNVGGAPTVVP
ncbi:MAG: VPS10 domain-containing protein [Gemmatimonadaceae bacterium]